MSKNGFNKNLQKSCAYCVHGAVIEFSNQTVCKKHGVTDKRDYCRSYKYDPLKRIPQNVKLSDNYNPEDFKLQNGEIFMKPNPNNKYPIPDYKKEIYVKPTVKNPNIIKTILNK